MARRTLNIRELRRQNDQAEQAAATAEAPSADPSADAAPARKRKARAPAAPKVRKPRAKKAPPRLRARWGLFDAGMKQVAVFDYNQRAAADAKLASLLATKKGTHFMQIVKEPMPEPEAVAAVGE